MERNITISLEKARELYYSNNKTLIGIALQAFSPSELTFDYTTIKTFKDACDVFGIDHELVEYQVKCLKEFSRASAAMFKLNIIRKALNFNQYLHLTKDPEDSYIYYPYNPFVNKSSTYYKSDINLGNMEIISKIKSEGEEYNILCGYACGGVSAGLGCFGYSDGFDAADAYFGFLGCATKEIAQHLGKYFGMLITEAKYGDLTDFEIVERKYQ